MILKVIAGPVIGAIIGYCTNYVAVKMLFHPKKEIKVFGHRLPFTPGAIPKGKSRLAKSIGDAVGNNLVTQADIEEKLLSDDIADKIAETILTQFSIPTKELIGEIPNISEDEISDKKENVAKFIGKYIAQAVSQIELSDIIVEKAPDIIKSKLDNPMISMFLTDELIQSILAPVGIEIQKYIEEHGEEFITPYVSKKMNEMGEMTFVDIMGQLSVDRDKLKEMISALYKKAVSSCSANLMKWIDLNSIVENKINAMSNDDLETLVISVMKKEFNTIVNLGALIGLLLGIFNIFF